MKIRNMRPGPLVIADAKIRLAPGEVVEVEDITRQMLTAVERGFIEEVPDDVPTGSPATKKPAQSLPGDYERLSASEAIEYVDDEDDPKKLKVILKTEKRKTVVDALRKRLEEVKASAAE